MIFSLAACGVSVRLNFSPVKRLLVECVLPDFTGKKWGALRMFPTMSTWFKCLPEIAFLWSGSSCLNLTRQIVLCERAVLSFHALVTVAKLRKCCVMFAFSLNVEVCDQTRNAVVLTCVCSKARHVLHAVHNHPQHNHPKKQPFLLKFSKSRECMSSPCPPCFPRPLPTPMRKTALNHVFGQSSRIAEASRKCLTLVERLFVTAYLMTYHFGRMWCLCDVLREKTRFKHFAKHGRL